MHNLAHQFKREVSRIQYHHAKGDAFSLQLCHNRLFSIELQAWKQQVDLSPAGGADFSNKERWLSFQDLLHARSKSGNFWLTAYQFNDTIDKTPPLASP